MKRRRLGTSLFAVLLLAAPAAADKKVEYLAVFMEGKKLGHAVHTREVADGKVTTTEDMTITINRMGQSMTVRVIESAVETTDGKPLGFKTTQDLGILAQTTEGTVGADGTVTMKVEGGLGGKQETTFPWPEGALLPEGLRLVSLKKGLREGTKYTLKAFSGAAKSALDTEITVGPKKEVDLLGRVVKLTEVRTVMIAPTGRVEAIGYVNDRQDALKTVVPMMGMKMELVACSKEVALSPADPLDFFDKLVVTSPTPLGNVAGAKSIAYTLRPTGDDADLAFLTTPSQAVARASDGSVTVTVAPVKPGAKAAFPYQGKDPAAQKALRPTQYLQCDDEKIAQLAKKAVGKAADAAEAARKIESFVSNYIKTKDLSVGYASAREVADSAQGDCTEHAVLAAALCRAIGIPAQVVAGLGHVSRLGDKRDAFVPHAWYRAYVGGKWVDYDAALRGFDAGHIALTVGDGEPVDFFGILGTLGNFRIAKVAVKR